MRPKSNSLFHFTSNFETLLLILQNGFWAKYCAEDFDWYNKSISQIAYPMVCFCDIPLTRAMSHMDYYGKFGLGMTREWANRNCLNPVIYLADRGSLRKNILYLASKPSTSEHDVDNLFEILSMIKPTVGKMYNRSLNKYEERDFTQESEWRYIPPLPPRQRPIPFDEFEKNRDFHNQKILNEGLLGFDLSHISYIFVDSDSSVIKLINFLDDVLSTSHNIESLNILKSKIFVSERLSSDF